MITKLLHNRFLLTSFFTLFFITLQAQVGINTITPSDGAMLDIESGTKGILIPRVDIDDLSTIAPITGGSTESLLVYNTNTTTGKGFYFWDGTQWVILNSPDWKQGGNAGTTPGTAAGENFVGTSDDTDLVVARNSEERVRFTEDEVVFNDPQNGLDFRVATTGDNDTFFVDDSNDNIGVGVTPAASTKVEVYSAANQDAVTGYSDNVGGVLGREQDITFGSPPQTVSGAGVYANNPFSGYTSMFAQSTGAADVGALGAYSDVWIANYSYIDDNGNNFTNPPASYSQRNVTNATNANEKMAITALLVRGSTSGNPGYSTGIVSQAIADNEDGWGINAGIFSDTGASGGGVNAGGRFYSASSGGSTNSITYVAGYFSGTDYKVLGSGAVSTIVKDDNNEDRIMFAPEAPEVLFQDFGVGRLVNGVANITIDPVLAKNIMVDANHPLKVFVTLEGDCNGIFVTNKSANGFTVKELQNGTSNIDFSWQIVASRADDKDGRGATRSKYQDLRFPKLQLDANKTRRSSDGRIMQEKLQQNFSNKESK